MIRLFIISVLLCILSFTQIDAQFTIEPHRYKEKFNWEPVKTIAIYTASMGLDAVAEGLRDNGNKDWAHALHWMSYVPLAVSPWVLKYENNKGEWATYIATYFGIRFMVTDYTYNAVRGLPLNYFGTTSVYDRVLGPMGRSDGLFMARVVVCSVTLSFTFNNLD